MAYIDLIVLGALIIFVGIYSKRFQTYIFGFGMIDILFRILNVLKGFIPSKEIVKIINTYVPSSVPDVINNHTKGMVNTALTFVYVLIMALFLFYIVKIFIKRKKF